jgi:hypothetical protein
MTDPELGVGRQHELILLWNGRISADLRKIIINNNNNNMNNNNKNTNNNNNKNKNKRLGFSRKKGGK